MLEERLTVCTVSYGHAPHLDLNWRLAQRLNAGVEDRLEWLVAENAPGTNGVRLSGAEPQFTHYPGHADRSLGASDQHAQALNQLLKHAGGRFVLVLDPDFYILRRDWITEITDYMKAKRLAFFGAPWHPRYTENYRYFPAVHCMFIDRAAVRLDDLDFRPILSDDAAASPAGAADGRLSRLMRRARFEHRRRKPWDTGARIFNRYGRDPAFRSECVVPVYKIRRDWLGNTNPLSAKNRGLEWLLPDEKCYLPKRRDSYTSKGFAERGWNIPDPPPLWEQHLWRETPFGLHIRRSFGSDARDSAGELDACRRVIDALCPPSGPPD